MASHKHLTATGHWTPGTVGNLSGSSTVVTLPGAMPTDNVIATLSPPPPIGIFLSAFATSGDTVTVTLVNLSGVAQTIGSCNLRVDAF